MCDRLHLVPDVEETRVATVRLRCCECRRGISRGKKFRYVEGVLDDGSAKRFVYRAHEECYYEAVQDTPLDPDNDGCFVYGRVEVLKEAM
jgi:hypothetical protein